jgi:hypothetical protein
MTSQDKFPANILLIIDLTLRRMEGMKERNLRDEAGNICRTRSFVPPARCGELS